MKEFDLATFMDEGILQEVNRVFFHPLGLALTTMCDRDADGKVVPHRMGPVIATEDPEGLVFDPPDAEKRERFEKWKANRTPERFAALGFTIEGESE
jgi:hypothetical protein